VGAVAVDAMSERYPDVKPLLRARLREALLDDGVDALEVDAQVSEVVSFVEERTSTGRGGDQ
jgi:hypothetical protein